MLAMDQAMSLSLVNRSSKSRSSGDQEMQAPRICGNICHLLLTFAPAADTNRIVGTIVRSKTFQYLKNLRLSKRLLRIPVWDKISSTDALPHVDESIKTPLQLQNWICNHSINPKISAPFGFLALPSYTMGPSLLFFWHHALTDARGGELLVHHIGRLREGAEELEIPVPQNTWRRQLTDSIKMAHRTKKVIFSKSAPSIVRISGVVPQKLVPHPSYTFIEFSSEETQKIDLLSQEVCNGISPMAMYLAATKRAALPFFQVSAEERGKIFIPVPHDMKRFTREKSPLSNQISVLFFSLESTSRFTLKEETSQIIAQLHDSIFSEYHWGMLSFLRFLRWLPSHLLWRTIEQPTKGHPASFYFSDIGSTLSQVSEFLGLELHNAVHYPPVLVPPGLTTVWSRFRGTLRVTICFDQNVLSNESIDTFTQRLKRELGVIA